MGDHAGSPDRWQWARRNGETWAHPASFLLRTTNQTVDAVAAAVGYQNTSTLRALVRRRRGTTISSLRQVRPAPDVAPPGSEAGEVNHLAQRGHLSSALSRSARGPPVSRRGRSARMMMSSVSSRVCSEREDQGNEQR